MPAVYLTHQNSLAGLLESSRTLLLEGTPVEVPTTYLQPFTSSAALDDFAISYFRTQWDNENTGVAGDGNDHTQNYIADVNDQVTVSGGELVASCALQNYGESDIVALRKWSGTGSIKFKVRGDTNSESQIVFMVTDKPYPFTGFDGENANGPKPANGFGIYAGCPMGRVWNNYVQTDYWQFGSPGPCSGIVTKGTTQNWEIAIISGLVVVTINGSEAIPPFAAPTAMAAGQGGWVVLGTHNHASDKYTTVDVVTNYFDDLEYSAYAPARKAEVPVAGPMQFGWSLPGIGSGVARNTTSLTKSDATEAWLLCNVGGLAHTDFTSSSRLQYKLNGGLSHEVSFQLAEHAFPGTHAFSIPLDINELVDGVNTVEFTGSNIANQSSTRIANIKIIARTAGALPPTPTPTLTSLTPNTGSTAGGATITVVGTNFIFGATTVNVDGTSVPMTVTSTTGGTFTLPAHAAGAVNVTVTTVGGTSGTQTFTYSAPTVPGIPTGLLSTAGDGSVALSWTVPASNGGSAITDYIVQWRTTSGPGSWNTFADGTSTATTATVTGLTNGTSYDFQVAAVNAIGTGTYTAPDTETPTSVSAPAPTERATPTLSGGASRTSYTFTEAEAGNPVNNSIIKAIIYLENPSAVVTPPSGWSSTFNGSVLEQSLTTPDGWRAQAFWIRRGASAPSYAFTWSGGSTYSQVAIASYDGARTTGDPWSFGTEAVRNTSGNTWPDVSGTTLEGNNLCIATYMNYVGNNVSSAPSGYTTRFNVGGNDIFWFHKVKAAAGSESITGVAWSGTNSNASSMLVALRPA